MDVIMENVRQYILALVKAGDFTQKELADASTVPLETVRHVLSGRTGKNAGFATIAKMIVAKTPLCPGSSLTSLEQALRAI